MEMFDVWKLGSVLFWIESARKDAVKWHIDNGDRDVKVSEAFRGKWIDPLLEDVRNLASKGELEAADSRVNPNGGFSNALEGGLTYQEVDYELKVLRECIQVDLSGKFVYIVERRRHEYNTRDFHLEMWGRTGFFFPSIRKDSTAAMRAYVRDMPTACVFHLMRVTEIGLRALARRMRVTLKNKSLEWGQWQEVINAMNKKVDALATSRRAGQRKDDLLEFYRGSIGEFLGFKDAYRNFVMHMRDKDSYDEDEAKSLIGRVSHFMNRLSQEIDEKGCVLTQKRINRMVAKIDADRLMAEKEKQKENAKSQSGIPAVRPDNAQVAASPTQPDKGAIGGGESSQDKKAEV